MPCARAVGTHPSSSKLSVAKPQPEACGMVASLRGTRSAFHVSAFWRLFHFLFLASVGPPASVSDWRLRSKFSSGMPRPHSCTVGLSVLHLSRAVPSWKGWVALGLVLAFTPGSACSQGYYEPPALAFGFQPSAHSNPALCVAPAVLMELHHAPCSAAATSPGEMSPLCWWDIGAQRLQDWE